MEECVTVFPEEPLARGVCLPAERGRRNVPTVAILGIRPVIMDLAVTQMHGGVVRLPVVQVCSTMPAEDSTA